MVFRYEWLSGTEDIKTRGGWQRHPTRDIRSGGHEIDVIVTPFEQPTGLETILNHGSRQELILSLSSRKNPFLFLTKRLIKVIILQEVRSDGSNYWEGVVINSITYFFYT